jgi:general secretion pathway protein G
MGDVSMQVTSLVAERERKRPHALSDVSGFTLIELMLVVIIIGVIAAIAIPRMTGKTEQARRVATKQSIQSMCAALDQFELNVGQFPSTEEGLEALVERPASLDEESGWNGPYIREIPLDAWNRPLTYRYPGELSVDYDLISAGHDGEEGTEDDITNMRQRQ